MHIAVSTSIPTSLQISVDVDTDVDAIQHSSTRYPFTHLPAYLLLRAVPTRLCYSRLMTAHITALLKHPYILYSTVALLVLAGGFLRFYDLGAQSYWMDEGYTVNAVQALQEKGEPILDSGQPYRCPMYCWPSALLADTFGSTPSSYRLFSATIGTLFIAVIFFITRYMFTTNVALLSTTLIAFSDIHIAWSRQARWYTLLTLLFWLALFFFYRAHHYTEHRTRNYALAALATVLACLTHTLGLLLPLIFVIWALIEHVRTHAPWKHVWYPLATALGAIALLALITQSNPFAWLSTHTTTPTLDFPYYLAYYIRAYWLFIPLIALVWIVPSPHRKPATYLLLAGAVYLTPLTFLTDNIQYRYLFHLTPALLIVGAVGALALHTRLTRTLHKAVLWLTLALLFFATNSGTLIPRTHYYLESDPQVSYLLQTPYYAYVPQPDWRSAYTYVQTHRTEGDIIVSAQPVFTKIYLGEPGYSLHYSLLGASEESVPEVNGKEYYVGATVLHDRAELSDLLATHHGYIILDFFSLDGRLSRETLAYIQNNTQEVFHARTNDVSEVWVYAF